MQDTKDKIIASLLAQENLRVEHRAVSTAYFDLQNRILVLPIFKKEMPPEVKELLVGHEVGHALETPKQGWHDAVLGDFPKSLPNRGRGFKTYLNVVEDARIERLMKSRYPGLRKSFHLGYKKLWEEKFFGEFEPEQLLLIDRINLHYKVGAMLRVEFTEQEEKFLNMIDSLSSWEDTVDAAVAIYRYCIQEAKKREERRQADDMYKDMIRLGDDGDDADDSDDFENEFSEDFGDEADDDTDDQRSGVKGSGGLENPTDVESKTDAAFRQKEDALVDESAAPSTYVEIPRVDPRDVIVSHREVLKVFSVTPGNLSVPGIADFWKNVEIRSLHQEFLSRNSKYIGYLVKEFELRKNAAQLARAKQAKTGTLDTNKLFSYKFNEELFKSVTIVPNGKNHGMIMVIDWSGSMQSNLAATIEQTMVLLSFCRKVGIPFRVYAFLSYRAMPVLSGRQFTHENNAPPAIGDASTMGFPYSNFQLATLFSDRMTRTEFGEMSKRMLLLAEACRINQKFDQKFGYRATVYHLGMGLGGTPLHESIISVRYIIDQFKKDYKLDVVNAIFLTDGQGSYMSVHTPYNLRSNLRYSASTTYIDPITKKEVRAAGGAYAYLDRDLLQMKALVELTRAATGANIIGFYLANDTGSSLRSLVSRDSFENNKKDVEVLRKEMRRDRYATILNLGFNEYYVIKGGAEFDAQDESLQVEKDVTKRELLKAFMQNQNKKSVNRVLLNRFIRLIA